MSDMLVSIIAYVTFHVLVHRDSFKVIMKAFREIVAGSKPPDLVFNIKPIPSLNLQNKGFFGVIFYFREASGLY